MKKFKFILSILLVLCLTLSMAMPGFADTNKNADDEKKIETEKEIETGKNADRLGGSEKATLTGDREARAADLVEKLQSSRIVNNEQKREAAKTLLKQQQIVNKVSELKLDPETEVRAIVVFEGEAAANASSDPASKAFRNRVSRIETQQNAFMRSVNARNIDVQEHFRFSTLLNGLSLTTQVKNLTEIAAISGVANVYLANKYEAPEDISGPSNEQTGAAELINSGYNGDGLVVAVVDTGMDLAHEVFQPSDLITNPKLSAQDIADANFAFGAYVNEKVPFAANYWNEVDSPYENFSGHGTHVSGIAVGYAASGEGEILYSGAAPAAQLLALGVFDPDSGYTWSDIYVAAYEDAYILGADVINCSFGAVAGFTYDDEVDGVLEGIFLIMENAGIILTISAGNSGNLADDGLNWVSQSNPGERYIRESVNDYGVTGSPSTYEGNLSTASTEVSATKVSLLIGGAEHAYTDTGTGTLNFASNYAGTGALDIVYVPGYGATVQEFLNAGVAGKIALVSRGDSVSFVDKASNAEAAGAVAAIIFNNVSGSLINMALDGVTIPAIFVSDVAGALLIGGAVAEVQEVDLPNVPLSDFSSWGTTSDLKFKPNIAAPGGMVMSAVPDGGGNSYEEWSGTSMAAPNLAGNFADLLQYLREELEITDKYESSKIAEALALSTAQILLDENGVEISPRGQGAGLVNSAAAVQSPAYINEPLYELGDDPEKVGVYTLEVELTNLTDEDVSYTIEDPTVLQDVVVDDGYDTSYNTISSDYADVTLATDLGEVETYTTNPGDSNCDGKVLSSDAAYTLRVLTNVAGTTFSTLGALNADVDGTAGVSAADATHILRYLCGLTDLPEAEEITVGGDREVVVPANDSVVVTLTVSLTSAAKARLDAEREEGGFVEGYVVFRSEGNPDLHASFMGFYGDWTEGEILEKYDTGDVIDAWDWLVSTGYADYGYTPEDLLDDVQVGFNLAYTYGYDWFYLGDNLIEYAPYNPEHNAIAGWSDEAETYYNWAVVGEPMQLRNARRVIAVVQDVETGEVYSVEDWEYMRKATYDSDFSAYMPDVSYVWDGGIYDWQNGESFDNAYPSAYVTSGTKVSMSYYAWLDYDTEAEAIFADVDYADLATDMADYQVWTYDLTVDYTAPYVADWSINGDTMSVTLGDNHYIMTAYTHEGDWYDDGRGVYATEDVQGSATIEIDISGGLDNLYLDISDYATNWPTYMFDTDLEEWVLEGSGSSGEIITIDEARIYVEDEAEDWQGLQLTVCGWVTYSDGTEVFLTARESDITYYDYCYGIAIEMAEPTEFEWLESYVVTGYVGVDAHGNPALVDATVVEYMGYEYNEVWEWDFDSEIGSLSMAKYYDYSLRYTTLIMDWEESGIYQIKAIAPAAEGDGYDITINDGTASIVVLNVPEEDGYGTQTSDLKVGDYVGGIFTMCMYHGDFALHCVDAELIWFIDEEDGTGASEAVQLILDTQVPVTITRADVGVECVFTALADGYYTFSSISDGGLDPRAQSIAVATDWDEIFADDENDLDYVFEKYLAEGESFSYYSGLWYSEIGSYDVIVTQTILDTLTLVLDTAVEASIEASEFVLASFTAPTAGDYVFTSSNTNPSTLDPVAMALGSTWIWDEREILGDDIDYPDNANYQFGRTMEAGETFTYITTAYGDDGGAGSYDITVTRSESSGEIDPLLGDWYISFDTDIGTLYLSDNVVATGKLGATASPSVVYTIEASATTGQYRIKTDAGYLSYNNGTNVIFVSTPSSNTDFYISGSNGSYRFAVATTVGASMLRVLAFSVGSPYNTVATARCGAYATSNTTGYAFDITLTNAND